MGLLWDLYCPAGEGEGDESPIAAEGEKENDGEVTEVDKEKGDGGLPWKIEAGEGLEYDILDTFVNSVKEVRLPSLSRKIRRENRSRRMTIEI